MIQYKGGVYATLLDKIVKEKEKLNEEIKLLQKKMKGLPEGELICSSNGKYVKCYNNIGGKYHYIYSDNKELAEKLAIKKYFNEKLKYALNEKKAIENYLKVHKENGLNRLIEKPGYQALLKKCFNPISQELKDWAKEAYEKNPYYLENLNHKTISGNMVRSKSEVIIDMALYSNKIPFRYDCVLRLGHSTIYPDFTIRHPKTGELFYWEHFGLMDDPNYYNSACKKLVNYTAAGIVPGINLIPTFETNDCPLISELVDKIVKYYFL